MLVYLDLLAIFKTIAAVNALHTVLPLIKLYYLNHTFYIYIQALLLMYLEKEAILFLSTMSE